MVDSIGKSSLSREAIASAMRAQAEKTTALRDLASQVAGDSKTDKATHGSNFMSQLSEGVGAVDGKLKAAASLPEKMLTGEVQNLTEVAIQMKQADLSFRFAMEIRNKLIDAYREVMRMSV